MFNVLLSARSRYPPCHGIQFGIRDLSCQSSHTIGSGTWTRAIHSFPFLLNLSSFDGCFVVRGVREETAQVELEKGTIARTRRVGVGTLTGALLQEQTVTVRERVLGVGGACGECVRVHRCTVSRQAGDEWPGHARSRMRRACAGAQVH